MNLKMFNYERDPTQIFYKKHLDHKEMKLLVVNFWQWDNILQDLHALEL